MEKINKQKQGKKNKASGRAFEIKVRKDLEGQGWIVCKWSNQVDLELGKIVQIKAKFNPFTKRIMMNSGGFPDFLCFRRLTGNLYEVIGVEAKGGNKTNKYLDKVEKEKVNWLLNNNIFNFILIAQKGDKRGEILYEQQLKGGIKQKMEIKDYVKATGSFLKAEDIIKHPTASFVIHSEGFMNTSEKFGTERLHIEGNFNNEQKIFDCSKTNARVISSKLGEDTKNWIGKILTLETYKTKTSDGKLVDAINVKEVK